MPPTRGDEPGPPTKQSFVFGGCSFTVASIGPPCHPNQVLFFAARSSGGGVSPMPLCRVLFSRWRHSTRPCNHLRGGTVVPENKNRIPAQSRTDRNVILRGRNSKGKPFNAFVHTARFSRHEHSVSRISVCFPSVYLEQNKKASESPS